MANKTTIKCDECGKELLRWKSEINERNFCNKQCLSKYRKKRPRNNSKKEYQCKICGKKVLRWDCDVYDNIFCSRKCWNKYKKRDTYKCEYCNKEFLDNHHSNRFCSLECFQEWHRKENATNWKDGRSFEPYGIKCDDELRESIRKRDKYTCQNCGIKEKELDYKLDVHHIDYNFQNHHKSNLITLCRSCHSKSNYNRRDWQIYYESKICQNKQ